MRLMIALSAVFGMTSAGWAAPPGDVGRIGTTSARDQVVTLVTGDRVTLAAGDSRQLSVVPGKGRSGIVGFRVHKAGGTLYVVPTDVAPLVASGRLDRRLFDISGLIAAGYDDSRSRSIPLIVTYDGTAGPASVRSSGAETVRELPAINGTAVRVPKGKAFLEALPVSGQRFAGGVERVWLDGKRRTTLDQSVPQIGTPAAWQAGYTGKGVTVAVLDTGIDNTHPDLADRVAEARNFTEGPAGDHVGHGTHVASTIAGTGAAWNGTYKGVAPDTQLLDGKVCGDEFCEESAILAGMQWAVAERNADVVNLSLGGQDTPEVDPLEEAVNTLTAQTGALFVIAAGNDGPGGETVGSPGSADTALTVGAVDKFDELAWFSSRGPRVGDGAIKPDITAPGVDIVAARSKDAVIGAPVGEHYLRLSGTSMATPHTAGAAALLAQRHPEWAASELKAALMSSAKPHAGQGSFDQGAGRVDVAKAITQTVVAEPSSLAFGSVRWPHHDDQPVTKQLAYRNHGSGPVTLNLRSTITGPDGQPAPATAVSLSATSVTVPAGGTATLTVTSNTNHDGPDGAYSGRVTASGDGVSLGTPFAVTKEVESYDLTLSHLDPNGQPTGTADTVVVGLDDFMLRRLFDEDGTVSTRLPKGRYYIDGLIVDRGEKVDLHHLVQPILVLDRDSSIAVDGRITKPVTTTLRRRDPRPRFLEAGVTLDGLPVPTFGNVVVFEGQRLFTAPLGDPVTAPATLTAHVASQWGVPGVDGRYVNSPVTYALINTRKGKYWHGFSRTVDDLGLAKVTTRYNAQMADRQGARFMFARAPGVGGGGATTFVYDLPATATHYVEAGTATWSGWFDEFVPANGTIVSTLSSPERSFRAGRTYAERFNAAVFGPRFTGDLDSRAVRSGNTLSIFGTMYSDQDGHPGIAATDTASTKLFRGGVLIGQSEFDARIEVSDVAPEPADFKLVSTATRQSFSRFSTRTDAVWTFRSQLASEEAEPLPLWAARYFPSVDSRNLVQRHRVSVLPVKLETQPGAKPGSLTNVEVRASGDDGATWTNAAVRRTGHNQYVAVFPTPAGGYLSLKAKAADSNGNTTEQTIIRAYAMR